MITFTTETLDCVQGGGSFVACILSLDGKRFFATEDIEQILLSPDTLASKSDVTVILDWDRNSCEAPFMGPRMDMEFGGALYLHRVEGVVYLEGETPEGVRESLTSIPFTGWAEKVAAFAADEKNSFQAKQATTGQSTTAK